jgi:hypothetical protein
MKAVARAIAVSRLATRAFFRLTDLSPRLCNRAIDTGG